MSKDRKDKIIFAGVIFLAFLIANFFSNEGLVNKFTKDDEIVMISENDQDNKVENNKETHDDLINQDKKVYISGWMILLKELVV